MLQLEGSLQTFWSRNLKLWASGCLLPKWLSSPVLPSGAKTLCNLLPTIKNWKSFTSGQTGTSGPPGLSLPLMTTARGLGRQSMNLPFFRSLHPANFPSVCDLPPPKAHFFFFFFFTPQRSSPSLCQEGNNGSSKVSWLVQGHTKARSEAQNWFRFQGSFSTMPWCKIMFLTSRP